MVRSLTRRLHLGTRIAFEALNFTPLNRRLYGTYEGVLVCASDRGVGSQEISRRERSVPGLRRRSPCVRNVPRAYAAAFRYATRCAIEARYSLAVGTGRWLVRVTICGETHRWRRLAEQVQRGASLGWIGHDTDV